MSKNVSGNKPQTRNLNEKRIMPKKNKIAINVRKIFFLVQLILIPPLIKQRSTFYIGIY